MAKFLSDFRDFALRGNVIDMAVGVVIGGAFGKIVTSLVDNIIMPVVGVITGGTDFSDFKYVMQEAVLGPDGTVVTPEVAISWGLFIQAIVDFIIIALCIFMAIRFIQNLRRKNEPEPEAAPAPAGPTQEELLTEIRDLLAKQNKDLEKKA